jgi:hypothetical protein
MGQMLIHGLGCWYMDLACAGWQYHPLLWSRIHELHTLYDSVIGDLKPLQPDVAVVIDARAVSLVAHADAIGANVLYRMRLHFYRAGIKFGLYTSEDFEAGHVPSAKVVFYLTPFDISDERAEQLTLILRRQHSTLVLLHGPGRTSDESAKKLTGMNLVRMDGGQMELAMCAVPGFLTDGADFITEGDYNGLVQSANPAWYAQQNGRVRPLALYSKGPLAGKIATAYCEHDGFASVFTGALLLTSDAIREICRLGGAHIYSESGDTFFAGNGIYLLHTNKNTGVRTVTLPAPEHLMQFHGGYDSVVSLLPPVENPECPKNVYRTDGRATASYLWFDSARYSPAIPD